MKIICAALSLIFLSTSCHARPSKYEGPYGLANRQCIAEYSATYSKIVPENSTGGFCHCYARGFVFEMKADDRDRLYYAEKDANRRLRSKADLIALGFGKIQTTIETNCIKNPHAYDE